jgi:hypothetical protein
MGGRTVVYEKASQRVGLVIGSAEESDKAGSNKSTRVLVVWDALSEAVPVQLGKGVIGGIFPSLLLLKHSSKEFLTSLWETDPGLVVQLVLENLPDKAGASKEIAHELTSAPSPIDAKAGDLGKILKSLVLKGLISPDPTRKGWFTASSSPNGTWPAHLQWIWDYGLKTSKNQVQAKHEDTATEVLNSNKVEKKTASSKKESSANPASEITAVKTGPTPAAFFISDLLGEPELEPTGFAGWLADPWDAAAEIDKLASARGGLPLKKASRSQWPVISLTARSSWLAGDAGQFSKIFSSTIISQVGKGTGLDFASKPWIKTELIKTKSVDFTDNKPLQILRADGNIEALTGPDVLILTQLREHILKSAKFKNDYLEARKLDQDGADQLLGAMVSRTPSGAKRLQLALRAAKVLRIDLKKILIFQDAPIEDIESTLRSDLATSQSQVQWLKEAASDRMSQILPNLNSLDKSLRVIAMVGEFGLFVDSKSLGHAFRKSMLASPTANYLANEMFNQTAVQELAERLETAEKSSFQLESALKELRATAFKEEAELRKLRDKLLQSRLEEEDGFAKDAASAKLPILKALARAMAAAHELLGSNPQAVARFEIIGDQVGLQPIGAPGASVLFDPLTHDSPEGEIATDEPVTIKNVGYKWQNGEAELVLLKALVL